MFEAAVYNVIDRNQKRLALRSYNHAVRNYKKKTAYATPQSFFYMEFFNAYGFMPSGMSALARGK